MLDLIDSRTPTIRDHAADPAARLSYRHAPDGRGRRGSRPSFGSIRRARGIFPLDRLIVSKQARPYCPLRPFRDPRRPRFRRPSSRAAPAADDAGRIDVDQSAHPPASMANCSTSAIVHTVEAYEPDGQPCRRPLRRQDRRRLFRRKHVSPRDTTPPKSRSLHLVARLTRRPGIPIARHAIRDRPPGLVGLGAIEVSKESYRDMLADAVAQKADFWAWPKGKHVSGQEALAALAAPRD